MSKGLGRVQRLWLQGFSRLLEKREVREIYWRDSHLINLNISLADNLGKKGKMNRTGFLISISHARKRLLESGYLEKEWYGYVPEPVPLKSLPVEERLDYTLRTKRLGYYYSLTDKGRSWVGNSVKG